MSKCDVQGESGLSMVEMLVALAITSLLSLAVVWMLTTAVRVRDLSEMVGRSDQALIRLIGLSANLAQTEPEDVVVRGDGQIGLVYEPIGMEPYAATLEITQTIGTRGPVLRASAATLPDVTVDLSAFEEVSMEAFGRNESGGQWQETDFWPPNTQVGGVRLRLSSMSRTWFPVIWSRTRGMDLGGQ